MEQNVIRKVTFLHEFGKTFGKRETGILDLYMLAFKLAKEQLKISKED